ncbi:MAG: hypothetical protein ACRYG8_08055 [Janthinobacterium lividum]
MADTTGTFTTLSENWKHNVEETFTGHKSDWSFETSGTGALALGLVVAGGGEIKLIDPAGKEAVFHFGGAGAGLSIGVPKLLGYLSRVRKLAKIGQLFQKIDPHDVGGKGSASQAPENYPNHGLVYVLSGCPKPELQNADFKGVCLYLDLGISLYYGYSGEAMLMNCNPAAIAALSSGSPLAELTFMTQLHPHAMLLSWGPSRGLQANAGGSVSVGYLA